MAGLTKEEALYFLLDDPVALGHLVGFAKLTDLHNTWIRSMLFDAEDETLQAHRGSYKTTCLSLALANICVAMPWYKVLFMRKTDTDVEEIVEQTKKILLSPYMQAICNAIYGVDLKLTVSTATEISTNLCAHDPRGSAQITAKGIKSSLTGKHYDLIFTDDIINLTDRESRAEREKTKTRYQELPNLKNRDGRIFNIGTPWHPDDAFSIMPAPRRYTCYQTGLMTAEDIAILRERMAPSLFCANYELKHIASEDVLFTDPVTGGNPALCEQGMSHIDASYGGEDYTAFTQCCKRDGLYYVYGRLWRKHIDDCMTEVIQIRKRFNAGRLYLETNGDKGYLAKAFKRRGERVYSYHEDMNKYTKISSFVRAEWKNIVFVEGTDQAYIDMVCDYNENADHDDAPDSLACCIRALWRKNGATSDNAGASLYL